MLFSALTGVFGRMWLLPLQAQQERQGAALARLRPVFRPQAGEQHPRPVHPPQVFISTEFRKKKSEAKDGFNANLTHYSG